MSLIDVIIRLINRHDICLMAGAFIIGVGISIGIMRRIQQGGKFGGWWDAEGIGIAIISFAVGGLLIMGAS